MTIRERPLRDVTVLDLAGRLVFGDGVDELRAHINRLVGEGRRTILLNLKDGTYMDSCGVGLLVAKFVSVRRLGGDLALLCLSARCERVLTISRLTGIFQTFDSEAEALASFAGKAHA